MTHWALIPKRDTFETPGRRLTFCLDFDRFLSINPSQNL